ncbi:hypothetical protein KKD37_01170 [Patescibacteria group bacterium]|nr:hypothetical protein [Patescibacteria group bacterium]
MSSSGPKGINWTEVFQFYCETINDKLPSYKDVAKRFGVSKTEVGQKALEENWINLRQELYENGKTKFLENKSNQIAESETSQLDKWRAIQDLTDIYLDEINKDPSLKQVHKLYIVSKIIKIAIEGERIVLGLPNTVLPNRLTTREERQELSPELIQEIDRLFLINKALT